VRGVPVYFAYGSNMASAQLRERVGSARTLGVARLDGWDWRCDKHGADGTAKANLAADSRASAFGVLYEIGAPGLDALDRFEGGYRRVRVAVTDARGARVEAETYVSDRLGAATPGADYRALVLAGAREHALPPEWIARLERILGSG
jgi:gamma-glutamylcyclotransferase (GGCT)/AIG2-like uncharacterized protein YtfP